MVTLLDVNDGTVAQDMANADTNFDTITAYLDEIIAARNGVANLKAKIDELEAALSTSGVFSASEIAVASVGTPTNITADGGGLRVKGTTDKTILWDNSDDSFHSSEPIVVDSAGDNSFDGNVGIGTVSPNELLELSSFGSAGTGYPTIRLNDTDEGKGIGEPFGAIDFYGNDIGGSGVGAGIRAVGDIELTNGDAMALVLGAGPCTDGFTERMRITQDGNVGVGTTSPTAKLHLVDTDPTILKMDRLGDVWSLEMTGSGGIGLRSNTLSDYTWFATDEGNVGIGTTSPDEKLHIEEDSATAELKIERSGTSPSVLNFTAAGNLNQILATLGQRFDLYHGGDGITIKDGDVGIGNTAPNGLLEIGNSSSIGSTEGSSFLNDGRNRLSSTDGTAAAQHNSFYNPNGLVGSITTSASGTAFNTTSDYRLKENDIEIANGIELLNLLRPINFNFKADPTETITGFFAHEVQEVVPSAVTGDKDAVDGFGDKIIQQMDASKLVPVLTAALKEALTKIESLETRISALEA